MPQVLVNRQKIEKLPPGTLYATIDALAPDHFWRMEEQSGAFVDTGQISPASLLKDLDTFLNNPTRNLGDGESPNRVNYLTLNGTDQHVRTSAGVIDIDQSTGTIIFFCRPSQNNSNRTACGQANGSASQSLRVNELQFLHRRNGAANSINTFIAAGDFRPVQGEWSMVAISQTGAPTRPLQFYVNGVNVPDSDITEITSGTGTQQDYFDDCGGATNFVLGSRRFGSTNDLFWGGDITCMAHWQNQVLTAEEILQIAQAGEVA